MYTWGPMGILHRINKTVSDDPGTRERFLSRLFQEKSVLCTNLIQSKI